MLPFDQNQPGESNPLENQWKGIFTIGGWAALIVILGTLFDIVAGSISGGDLSAIPQTAIARYAQFQKNWFLGLYNLDLLNVLTSIILIPVYFALFAAHRRTYMAYAALAMILSLVATTIFVAANTALPMLALSAKYAVAATETQKEILAAAGEAMLARGEHGSPGVFIGFVLSSIASLSMSWVMLRGKVFHKATAYFGIIGNALLLIYIILVTFIPEIKPMAVMVAAPGGLLSLGWLIMLTLKLFNMGLACTNDSPHCNPKNCS